MNPIQGAADMLVESAKQHRQRGDTGHATMCDAMARQLRDLQAQPTDEQIDAIAGGPDLPRDLTGAFDHRAFARAVLVAAHGVLAAVAPIGADQIAEWRALQHAGMTSAVGEYTPAEFWTLLDAYEALLRTGGVGVLPGQQQEVDRG